MSVLEIVKVQKSPSATMSVSAKEIGGTTDHPYLVDPATLVYCSRHMSTIVSNESKTCFVSLQ